MKLTKENIQFIDNYLSNSDVKHLDIRLEMIDHIATAIEIEMQNGDDRDFYYIFKDYMVENKTKLLYGQRKFLREIFNKLGVELFKNLYKPICLTVLISAFALLIFLSETIPFDTLKVWTSGSLLVTFLIFAIAYAIGIHSTKLKRISSVERLGFFFAMLFQVFHFGWNISKFIKSEAHETLMFAIISLITAIFVSMLIVTFQIISESKEKYKMLT